MPPKTAASLSPQSAAAGAGRLLAFGLATLLLLLLTSLLRVLLILLVAVLLILLILLALLALLPLLALATMILLGLLILLILLFLVLLGHDVSRPCGKNAAKCRTKRPHPACPPAGSRRWVGWTPSIRAHQLE